MRRHRRKLESVIKGNYKKNKDTIPESIKNNNWNVHYVSNNNHAEIVIATKNKEAMTLITTTEEKDKDSKFLIKDGLTRHQKVKSYVKRRANVIPTNKINRKKKDASITPNDKNLIYENIKNYGNNPSKYKNLGNILSKKKELKLISSSAQCFIPKYRDQDESYITTEC